MADPRTINYAGNQKIDNTEMVSKKIDDAVQPVAADLAAEIERSTTEDQNLQNRIGKLRLDLNKEIEDREAGDTALDTKIGDLNDLETAAKENTVAAINELKQEIPEAINNLKEYVDNADEHLQEQVTELQDILLPLDEAPTKDSERVAKSGGTWDAIRFASVKVGETMYWHLQDDSSPEDRVVHSDNPFVFNFKGQEMSVETHDGHVQLCVLKDIPDGWHALDGKAELDAADYPDLAAFMPENVTTDGKIWLPYVQHKIIKVKY